MSSAQLNTHSGGQPEHVLQPHKQSLLNRTEILRDLIQAAPHVDHLTLYTRDSFTSDSKPRSAGQVSHTVIAVIKPNITGIGRSNEEPPQHSFGEVGGTGRSELNGGSRHKSQQISIFPKTLRC